MQWTAERRWQVLREVKRGASVKETCRRYGISRQTYYNWKKRFEREGLAGLKDKSRAPKRPRPRRRCREKEERVVREALLHPALTIVKLAKRLGLPKSTVHDILVDSGISTKRERRKHLFRHVLATREFTREQLLFLAEDNPIWLDFVFDWKTRGLQPEDTAQLGWFELRGGLLLVCIHTVSGAVFFLDVISSEDEVNITPAIQNAENRLPENVLILVRGKSLRENISEMQLQGEFLLTDEADDLPFGMLKAFEKWTRSLGRKRLGGLDILSEWEKYVSSILEPFREHWRHGQVRNGPERH